MVNADSVNVNGVIFQLGWVITFKIYKHFSHFVLTPRLLWSSKTTWQQRALIKRKISAPKIRFNMCWSKKHILKWTLADLYLCNIWVRDWSSVKRKMTLEQTWKSVKISTSFFWWKNLAQKTLSYDIKVSIGNNTTYHIKLQKISRSLLFSPCPLLLTFLFLESCICFAF